MPDPRFTLASMLRAAPRRAALLAAPRRAYLPRAALLVALVVLVLAPGAGAGARAGAIAAQTVAHAAPLAGPVIAGDFVEWVEGGGTHAILVRAAKPGGSPVVALRIGAPGRGRRRSVTALVSNGRRAEIAYRTIPSGLVGCVRSRLTLAIALAGSALAELQRSTTCDAGTPNSYQVLLHRAHGPAQVIADSTARLDHLTASGDHVAWQQAGNATSGDPIVLYDVAAASVRQRIVDPSLTIANDRLAVDAAGRLAAAVYDPSASTSSARYDLEWWSRGAAAPHQLPGLFATAAPIRFDGGRIAFERATGFSATALTLSNLAGNTTRIATFRRGTSALRGFDYAGRTVAWAQRGPGGSNLILRTSVPTGTG